MTLKKLLIPLILIAFSCEKETPEPPEPPVEAPAPVEECKVNLEDGLIAYYPFNGNTNDESGNGHHGIPKNGMVLTSNFLGQPNRAAGFDGVDDYILVEQSPSLNPEKITVSMMVQVDNINRRHSFLNSVNFEKVSGLNWGIGQSLEGTNNFDFAVTDKTADCSSPYVYNEKNLVSTAENMITQKWYLIVATFENGEQKLNIDGELKASVKRSFPTLKQCNAANLVIGGFWKDDIISTSGKIDEIRIYNRVLNEFEMAELSEIFVD